MQTSLYGASKLAGEGLIGAYCEAFGMRGWIFRFVSILGERYSHGHVFDFCKSLFQDPSALQVLGDGTQKKSYLYVKDCVEAIMVADGEVPGEGQHPQPRHGRVRQGQRLGPHHHQRAGRLSRSSRTREARRDGSGTTPSSS